MEFAIGATSKEQKERQRAARETRKMGDEDKLSHKVRVFQQRKEKQAIANQKFREEEENKSMAEEDSRARICRSENWKTPEQNRLDRIDRALACPFVFPG